SAYQCQPPWFLCSGSKVRFDVMPCTRGGAPVIIVVCAGYVTVGNTDSTERVAVARRPARGQRDRDRHHPDQGGEHAREGGARGVVTGRPEVSEHRAN